MSLYLPSRIADYYVKHPISTAGLLADKEPIDSGTMILIENNLAHLCHEAPRTLVQSLGFEVHKFASLSDMFSGFTRDNAVDASTASWPYVIPWDRRTSVRFGPFFMIGDRSDANSMRSARSVKCRLVISVGASASTHECAVMATRGKNPPRMSSQNGDGINAPLRVLSGAVTAGVTNTFEQTLAIPYDESGTKLMTCRAQSGTTQTQVPVTPFYLWFGWRIVSANSSYALSMSAYEVAS